jgi:large subunit ribosomal protein L24
MKLRKGDNIQMMRGRDAGKTGQVTRVHRDRDRVTVQGINMYTKHVRPTKQGEKGQSVHVPRAVAIANVMVICPACGKPSRLGNRMDGDKKVRFCKRCNAAL